MLFICPPLVAGPGHEHGPGGGHSHGPISAEAASKKAKKRIKQFISAGKIDASWANVKVASAKQKTYSKGPEWVVTFKNEKITDAKKQTLYFFYTLDGHYIAANFTGN